MPRKPGKERIPEVNFIGLSQYSTEKNIACQQNVELKPKNPSSLYGLNPLGHIVLKCRFVFFPATSAMVIFYMGSLTMSLFRRVGILRIGG